MKTIWFILILLLSACGKGTKEVKLNKDAVIKNVENLKDSISTQKLMTLTKTEAIQYYGVPSLKEQFKLNDAFGEFRINITDQYTSKERQSKTIVINELTWEKDKNTWITVWYEVQPEKSIPKAVYKWKKGDEF